VGSHNDFDREAFFKKSFERTDRGTGRITNDHSGGQVNHLRPVLDHLFTGILDVAARTTITSCKANQFKVGVSVYAKGPFPVSHRSKTFSACTATVAITDNYSNLRFRIHFCSLPKTQSFDFRPR
jgi:hypothetical protein